MSFSVICLCAALHGDMLGGLFFVFLQNIISTLQPNIFGTFVDPVKRLLSLSYGWFETIRHKTHSKGPVRKILLNGGRLLLQRSLSRKPCEQPKKGIIFCLANS